LVFVRELKKRLTSTHGERGKSRKKKDMIYLVPRHIGGGYNESSIELRKTLPNVF